MAKKTIKKPGNSETEPENEATKYDIEAILAEISEGKTYRDIAKRLEISLSMLHRFLSIKEHSARVELALEVSAHTYYDLAEQALRDISDTAENGEIVRQRELAQLYTKKAGKRNPKKYGDKIQQEHSGGVTLIPPGSTLQISQADADEALNDK